MSWFGSIPEVFPIVYHPTQSNVLLQSSFSIILTNSYRNEIRLLWSLRFTIEGFENLQAKDLKGLAISLWLLKKSPDEGHRQAPMGSWVNNKHKELLYSPNKFNKQFEGKRRFHPLYDGQLYSFFCLVNVKLWSTLFFVRCALIHAGLKLFGWYNHWFNV